MEEVKNNRIEEILKNYKTDANNRYNLLNLYTFTIDRNGTKRYDDAISLVKRESYTVLFVHITDIIEDINYHKKDSKKLRDFLYYHGLNNYDLSKSLVQGEKRNSITLVAIFDNNGRLSEYKFIKALINVDINLNCSDFSRNINKYKEQKEICKKLRELCFLYQNIKHQIIHLNKSNNPNQFISETSGLYSHLLGEEFIKTEIGKEFLKILLKDSSYIKGKFFVKATSPLYKGEAYINQLLIHDFILNDKKDLLEFWKQNKEMIVEYLDSGKQGQPILYDSGIQKKKNHNCSFKPAI